LIETSDPSGEERYPLDMLPKTVVGIRAPVFQRVYRAALQWEAVGCFGFLIGNWESLDHPVLDTALIVRQVTALADFAEMPRLLDETFAPCQSTAEAAEAVPMGLVVAWDRHILQGENRLFGALVDSALTLRLPYVVSFATDGGEVTFAPQIYIASRYPHDPLPYKKLPRRSHLPQHNPDRIAHFWRSCLMGSEGGSVADSVGPREQTGPGKKVSDPWGERRAGRTTVDKHG
jgi:hypothetical protein